MGLLEGLKGHFFGFFLWKTSIFPGSMRFLELCVCPKKNWGWRDEKGFLFSLAFSPGQLIIKV